MALTTNFSWDKPDVGGEQGAWGGILNLLIDAIDTELNTTNTNVTAATATADAALPVAAGVMTGRLDTEVSTAALDARGSISGAQNLDLADANVFSATITGATAFTFANPPIGTFLTAIIIELTDPSTNITWPASVVWAGGAEPTFTTSGVDVVAGYTIDDGVTWVLGLVQKDVS